MSLSKNRIFIGQSGLVLEEEELLRQQREDNLWDEETEKKFIEKIKQKAREQARKIIDKAKKEAEILKKQAYQEGYKEGQRKAEEEIKRLKETISSNLAKILEEIDRQKIKIWSAFKEDLSQLVGICLKKVLHVSFDKNKREVLEAFLNEVLEIVRENREISLLLSEKDREIIEDILNDIKKRYQKIEKWNIEWHKELAEGTVIVETRDSKVETSFEDRIKEVMRILERIGPDNIS